MNAQRLEELDRITVLIDHMAQLFGVSWRHASWRARDLNLVSQQDLDDIHDLAQQEKLAAHLRD